MNPDEILPHIYSAYKITEFGINKIKEYANKFRNKEVNFVGDEKTIEDVNKTRTTTEFDFYKKYIDDNELNILLRCGMILKKYEDEGEKLKPKLQNLRDKLFRKSKDSLWFAQLVQNGLLKGYINILIDENYTIGEIKNRIKRIYEKIDNFSYFVQEKDNDEMIKREVFRLISSKPEVLLISSKGVVSFNLRRIKKDIMDQHKEAYKYQLIEDEYKLLIFFLLKANA